MRKNKKKNYIGLGLLFLIGLSILLYPMVSDAWNRYRDSLLISNYSSSVSSDDNSEKIDSMWKAAQEYNEQIKQESVPDAFSVRDGQTDSTYESLLNLNGDGMMGYVEIPVIDVSIPIYHYTTDESLEKGAGHLFGSSLPVGGKSTHCILSAHRGLPSAKREMFFTCMCWVRLLPTRWIRFLPFFRSRQSLWVSRMGMIM